MKGRDRQTDRQRNQVAFPFILILLETQYHQKLDINDDGGATSFGWFSIFLQKSEAGHWRHCIAQISQLNKTLLLL